LAAGWEALLEISLQFSFPLLPAFSLPRSLSLSREQNARSKGMATAPGSGRLNPRGKNRSEVKIVPFFTFCYPPLPIFSIPLLIAPDFLISLTLGSVWRLDVAIGHGEDGQRRAGGTR
jgi:hypothetical protein